MVNEESEIKVKIKYVRLWNTVYVVIFEWLNLRK